MMPTTRSNSPIRHPALRHPAIRRASALPALLPALLAGLTLVAWPAQAAPSPAPAQAPGVLQAAGASAKTATETAAKTAAELQLAQNTGLPPGARGKRAGPAEVAPVVIGSVSYGVLHFGKAEGLEQNGGYIEAKDKQSGARLWTLKVYDNHANPELEGDVQDVFITSLKRHGRALDVVDEKGRRYRVDVAKRTVTKK